MDDCFVNIRPRRDVSATERAIRANILDDTKLLGSIWEHLDDKGSSNMTVYVGPVVSMFGFDIEPVSGDMPEPQFQEGMLDSFGSMAKFWVASLHEANKKGGGSQKVLKFFGKDTLKSVILKWGE